MTKKNNSKPVLTQKNHDSALQLLFYVTDFMDKYGIIYHLEGGTLLGIVRDKKLLPWDYDVDISLPADQIDKFQKHCGKMTSWQYKLTSKLFDVTYMALPKGSPRIYKLKPRLTSFLKELNSSFRDKHIVIDIFIKYDDEESTYWQAADKAMKVSKHHYQGFDEVEFMGKKLKTPVDYDGYLTSKYGDWRVPIKEWNCSTDEKTICSQLTQ